MKILSLNYRGLGIPELRYLASEEGPKVLFLSKTRLDRYGFTRLKRKLRLNKGFAVPRIGLGGGLALLWWDNLDIDVQSSSPNHINALVKQDGVVLALYWFLWTS